MSGSEPLNSRVSRPSEPGTLHSMWVILLVIDMRGVIMELLPGHQIESMAVSGVGVSAARWTLEGANF